MIRQLLNHLNIKIVRPEGDNQYLCTCPACGGEKMYVNQTTGLWDCKRGCGNGNPFQLVQFVQPNITDKEVFAILEQCGLNTDAKAAAPQQQQPPKKLAITAADCRPITDAEVSQVCESKQLDRAALALFEPFASVHQPEMLIPAFNPTDASKACAVLRCRFDGKLIQTKHGAEKYPLVFGSSHGLLGIRKQSPSDTVIFAEGWRDALAAIEAGFTATASTGGASCFKDEWLPFFTGKTVYIVMDRDIAGDKAATKAANKIWHVAKEVKIIDLPYPIIEGQHGKGLKEFLRGVE
jgi:hypothetical protein